ILVVLWQGLGLSTMILALVCLFCLGLAVILAGRAATVALRPPGKRHNCGLVRRCWRSLTGTANVAPTIEQADKSWREEVRGYAKWSPEAGDEYFSPLGIHSKTESSTASGARFET